MSAVVNLVEGSTQLILCFENTTGPGLQDVILLQPGHNLISLSNITNLTLAHLSRFDMIRFNPWTLSNTGFEANWSDRTPLNWPQYSAPNHNPWETIPYLVNQLHKTVDVWINIPWNATDDYILTLARLMLDNLNKNNIIYVEYSNEVWNYLFPTAPANEHAANDSVFNHSDPYRFNYDNCSNSVVWGWRRTVYQTKHIADLFKTVFGQDNVGQWKRVRPILGGEASYPALIINCLDYFNAIFGPPSKFFHAIAVAPYFDLGPYGTWKNLTTDQVLDALNSSIEQFLPEQGWGEQASLGVHATYAAWYNLPVYGYEGGPDVATGCEDCSLEAKNNATRHPRMTDICITFLNGWYQFGFLTFNWFLAGASRIDVAIGPWTLLEDMRQETLIDTTTMFNSTSPVAQLPRPAPKLKAIDQVSQSSIDFNFGIPIPSLNFNATHYMHHHVPDPNPDLRYLQPNSTFYYPLQIRQAPIQINITVYVGGKSGLLEGAINNEQFVQVQTPETANTTTFQAAPSMLFNLTQITIPSIVAFRIRNIQIGYSICSFDVTSF
jgi:hypothetical protein